MKREKLYELRKEAKLTQKQMSEFANINRSYYGLIENGERNPSLPIAEDISEALGKKVEEVFDNEVFFANKCYVKKQSPKAS
ncbi:helix-turn-helix transcriptional regulator [Acetobacterium wieringae]|uniref:helix-turn-helix transcriptional regulator n=1 Tax=Acetobacterium wieringae TaxID=52694 RepID=UPI00203428FC|nr:helix-turn-helix domain-containing protein [Acetobacterium wieringae]URN85827.1 helix-turn-helix domain-containing protein [Acetobacterium wieringae]